jgi:hypothetical protein
MKKLLVPLVILTVALLVSCDNGTAPSVSEEKFKFEGHYDVYYWNSTQKGGDTSKEALLKDWLNGGFSKDEENCVYFEGEKFWMLNNNSNRGYPMGSFSLYDDDHIVWNLGGNNVYQGTEKFTVIEKDTIFLHMIGDDPSGISNGMSWFTGRVFKKSGRKGHMETKNQSYWFVDD